MEDQKPPRKHSWFRTSKRKESNAETDSILPSWRKYFFLKRRRSKREDALFFDIEDSRFPSAPCVCTHFQMAPPEPRSESPTRQQQLEEHVYEEVPDEDDVYDVGQVQPHTQVDYVNYLIPKMSEIISCPYYWGKIDRYEAEALLEGKPEGSFLLRDSAQDDFVFSVSFRRYNRSLHARIEESGHKFSFDCHDPGVHSSPSVCGLLEFYKDPVSCMFFEPMLLYPVVRTSCFSLQALARSAIADNCSYSAITSLPLPKPLKCFIREYHYRHKVRTRHLE